MEITETFYPSDRLQWRAWLEANFESRDDIWLMVPLKASGEQGVSYNDSVEEALCFGWIDSTAKAFDEGHQVRRFTRRRKGSPYSRLNLERLKRRDSLGLSQPSIKPSVEEIINRSFVFPEDILDEIRRDETAWANYLSFSEPYKRIRIAYIDDARDRPAEFEKRLASFIRKTKENKLITGYGGTDQYY